ncbi:hypothetical protein [Enterobacter roggenkampii]|uniref:hypothetical protein n=1 Tax=Enterobacter roggenkampii TaxID=1812935 RepID=UPI0005EFDB80|nr:hypothetical protein [Enterobacter roggenkampii]KJO24385.1 hypothetical protein SS06_22430 [Enterobacter roggenkampii]
MSTITKQWLQQKIAEMEAARDEIPFGLDEDDRNTLAAMKLALASLEAEPAEWRVVFKLDGQPGSDFEKTFENQARMNEIISLHERAGFSASITPLFTTPPAPVSVPDFGALTKCIVQRLVDYGAADDDAIASAEEFVYNACRAAMLQSGNSPAQDCIAPAQDCIAPAQGGNSPVIPDGWVLVPIEPTEDMIVNGFESEPDESFSDEKVWEEYDAMSGCQQAAHRAKLCWAAMIAASPAYRKVNRQG